MKHCRIKNFNCILQSLFSEFNAQCTGLYDGWPILGKFKPAKIQPAFNLVYLFNIILCTFVLTGIYHGVLYITYVDMYI